MKKYILGFGIIFSLAVGLSNVYAQSNCGSPAIVPTGTTQTAQQAQINAAYYACIGVNLEDQVRSLKTQLQAQQTAGSVSQPATPKASSPTIQKPSIVSSPEHKTTRYEPVTTTISDEDYNQNQALNSIQTDELNTYMKLDALDTKTKKAVTKMWFAMSILFVASIINFIRRP
jgi:hypothetical protein